MFACNFCLFLAIFCCFSHAVRIYYKRCNGDGFTCQNRADKRSLITYQCPNGVNDVTIYINQFSAPSSIASLTIKNCHTLSVSTSCSAERKPMEELNIWNITKLKFERVQYVTTLPQVVRLENISFIETVPSYTFAQSDQTAHTTCFLPPTDFDSIYIKNVTIDILQSNAMVGLKAFANFSMENVRINRLQTSAVRLSITKYGVFSIKESSLDVLEPLAFMIEAPSIKIYNSKFFDLSPNAINATTEILHFFANKVSNLQSHALSLLVQYCYIIDNQFDYMKSNALANISPGVLTTNRVNIGKLKFVFNFSKNVLGFTEAGCLHPDMPSYENTGSEVSFNGNYLYCSCENLGWLVSRTGHGYNTIPLEGFYEIVMDENSENNCSHSCDLPIKFMNKLVKNGTCSENVTIDYLCLLRDATTTTTIPEISTPNIPTTTQTKNGTGNHFKSIYTTLFLFFILCSLF